MQLLLPVILIISIFFITGCAAGTISESDETVQTPSEEPEQVEDPGGASAETSDPEEDEEMPEQDKQSGSPLVNGIIEKSEYENSLSDGPTGIELFWSHDGSELYIGIKTEAAGWVSVGFDPESAMKGANIIFLALDEGKLKVRDDFGTSSFGHDDDIRLGGSEDILKSEAGKEGSFTVYEFTVPLDSGDEFDKVLSPGNTYNIILAINNNSVDFDRVHSARSSGQIKLD